MFDEFIIDLEELYLNVINYKDKIYINKFKEKWSINKSIGIFYEELLLENNRKKKGSFYTPFVIYNYINDILIEDIDKKKKFNIRILDPSCGGGFFLIDLYLKLDTILKEEDLPNRKKFIIEKILYGKDLDKHAVIITIIELFYLSGYISENIICEDFLLGETKESYDYIVGNPPYIGHKMVNIEYKNNIIKTYGDVFYGKGDLNYCFIKRSIKLLNNNGKLVFFTSRYILESLYGKRIRDYILNESNLNTLIDFYGVRIIKGVGVDSLIIFIDKNTSKKEKINYFKVNLNGKGKGEEVLKDIKAGNRKYTKHVITNKESLYTNHWLFLTEVEKNIIKKIENKCNYTLKDICKSFQGIITGRDKAFIIDREEAETLDIEKDILKPWIKGKQIRKFKVSKTDKMIIYSDSIDKVENYKGVISYLKRYKKQLEKRRECANGTKPWYAIQWGRKEENFVGEKIVFPYKANSNRFAIDKGNYFSADIYSIKLKDIYKEIYSYKFLVAILNSSIYEFYIKSMSKKLGEDLYDYYPNKIMDILIPDLIKDIEYVHLKEEKINEIDKILNGYFDISNEEFNVIKSWCN